MGVLKVCLLTIALFSAVFARPGPYAQGLQPPKEHATHFLRVFAPSQPWHKRHLVQLPTSHLLGLENFTVHPTTPPAYVTPIRIPGSSTYALKLPDGGDDLSRTPYVATVQFNGAVTAALGAIFVPDPTKGTVEASPDACPRGESCVADAFSQYEGEDGLQRLSYEQFSGAWVAVKNARNNEGWHVYWKGKGGSANASNFLDAEIELELVPSGYLASYRPCAGPDSTD